MEVRSDRRFRLAASPEQLWEAISRTGCYRRWWPWLRRFDTGGLVAGDVWRCTVQPPLPYTVRFTVTLDEVVAPRLIRATVEGDVTGTATLSVSPSEQGCEARLVSALAPRGVVLSALTVAARPVVRFGHDWVLDTGARQFAERALPPGLR